MLASAAMAAMRVSTPAGTAAWLRSEGVATRARWARAGWGRDGTLLRATLVRDCGVEGAERVLAREARVSTHFWLEGARIRRS